MNAEERTAIAGLRLVWREILPPGRQELAFGLWVLGIGAAVFFLGRAIAKAGRKA